MIPQIIKKSCQNLIIKISSFKNLSIFLPIQVLIIGISTIPTLFFHTFYSSNWCILNYCHNVNKLRVLFSKL